MSSRNSTRRDGRRLASAIADYEQVLITAAVAEDVPDELRAREIRVRAGRILAEGEE